MLPTINSLGEIIVIEKMSHRMYGIDGGSNGEKRAKDNRSRQKEWEKQEHKIFLANSKGKEVYAPTWFRRKPLEANHANHKKLSSLSQRISRLTSGINVGDVIVVEHPEREGTVCKRVLGLPGDLILRPKFSSGEHRDLLKKFENTNGTDVEDSSVAFLNESTLEIVPDSHLWVEGDNSTNSADSRNYGSVPSALVVGKVWFRVWPLRGDALIVRGGRPMPPKHTPFTGSTAIPAGCNGEKLVHASNEH
jgi:signal peptidase I